MTPTPLRDDMSRSTKPMFLGVVLALLLLSGANATAQPTAPGEDPLAPDEGRIQITLHARASAHGDPPQLFYEYVLNTTVSGNQTHRELRIPLPENANLHDLTVHQNPTIPAPQTREEIDAQGAWAVATWEPDEGPAPGETITMRLEARRHVVPDDEIDVEWDRLSGNLTRARVLLPSTHTPETGPGQQIDREDPIGGLSAWNLTGTRNPLAFTIRPLGDLEDPALAAPPPRWSAYAVILMLALVSGTLWFFGKKAESRKLERERGRAPRP